MPAAIRWGGWPAYMRRLRRLRRLGTCATMGTADGGRGGVECSGGGRCRSEAGSMAGREETRFLRFVRPWRTPVGMTLWWVVGAVPSR